MKLQFDRFTLDTDRRQLFRDSDTVHLSPKAFELLARLAQRAPNAVSKDELQKQLWPDTFVSDGNLAVLVAEVRTALGDTAHTSRFVRTVQRFGYAFCGDTATAPSSMRPAMPSDLCGALLVWETDRGTGRVALNEGSTILGRSADADIQFDTPGVSRRHARIVVSGGTATLEDLGSKNGTYLDGQRITGAVSLAGGAVIRLGPLEVRFRVPSDDETATVAI